MTGTGTVPTYHIPVLGVRIRRLRMFLGNHSQFVQSVQHSAFFFFDMGIIVKLYRKFPFLLAAVILFESYCTLPSVVDQ